MSAGLHVVMATRGDVPLILQFIRDLADYERMSDRCVATEDKLHATLFGDAPAAEVLIARLDDEPVGFALFYHDYSTFLAQRGMYLEDLFVKPDARGKGVGYALLSALARLAVDRGCGGLEWVVLDWNDLAISFYERIGATAMKEWVTFRIAGDPLQRLAGRSIQ